MNRHSIINTTTSGAFTIALPLLIVFMLIFIGSLTDDGKYRMVFAQEPSSKSISIPASNDTYITQGQPNEDRNTEPSIWVGNNTDAGFGTQRSLIGFDLGMIPADSTIEQAVLKLNVGAFTTDNVSVSISVQRVEVDWQSVVTWNSVNGQIDINRQPVIGTDVPAVDNGAFQWDITSIVNELTNEGERFVSLVLLGNESVSDHERAFWSNDCSVEECVKPLLEITYIEPVPEPEPSIDLSINADWQSATNTEGTAILPTQPITVDIEAQNGSVASSGLVLTSTIPSGFELIEGSVIPEGLHDDSREPQLIIWDIDDLNVEQSVTSMYQIQLSAVETTTLTFNDSDTFDTAKKNQETPFALENAPAGEQYCYLWDFGDGTRYALKEAGTSYVYSVAGTYTVTVKISDPESYRGFAQTLVTVTNDENDPPAMVNLESSCTYQPIQTEVQNVKINAEISGKSSDGKSVSDTTLWLIAPSERTNMPLWMRMP